MDFKLWIWGIFGGLLTYFAPLKETYIVTLLFVGADLIAGIVASSRRHIPRSSRRGRKSVEKLFCYLGAVSLAYVAEHAFGVDGWVSTYKIIAGFICLVEFVSILENMAIITEKPVFLKIVKLIRGKAREKHGSIVDDIFNEKNDL